MQRIQDRVPTTLRAALIYVFAILAQDFERLHPDDNDPYHEETEGDHTAR
jgi:hypothetical protein